LVELTVSEVLLLGDIALPNLAHKDLLDSVSGLSPMMITGGVDSDRGSPCLFSLCAAR
jgi:hypothetical protein